MSDFFHKSCYTSRSSGYKYRTLSTNTGERKRLNSQEESTFDRKFKELRRVIIFRVNKEVKATQKARDAIKCKSEKIESKINSMVELHNTMSGLRKDLRNAEYNLANITDKVDRLEMFTTASDVYSMRSIKSPFRIQCPIMEEEEECCSIITHI